MHTHTVIFHDVNDQKPIHKLEYIVTDIVSDGVLVDPITYNGQPIKDFGSNEPLWGVTLQEMAKDYVILVTVDNVHTFMWQHRNIEYLLVIKV